MEDYYTKEEGKEQEIWSTGEILWEEMYNFWKESSILPFYEKTEGF